MGEIDVHDVVPAADVVDLAIGRGVDQQVDRAAMIEHVQPVAYVAAVAVERNRNVVDGVGDKQQDDLLRKLGTARNCWTRALR
mgnify:CR=1 FL=1